MTSSIWRPSPVGAPGGKEISIHNFEELAALHAVAKILAQPGELRDQIEQALREMSDRLGMQRRMIFLLGRSRVLLSRSTVLPFPKGHAQHGSGPQA